MAAAIGLMAKAPQPGLAKTRLIGALGEQGAADLARAFLVDSAALLRRLDIASFAVVTPAEETAPVGAIAGLPAIPQREGDLGARMEAAFEDLFALGFSPVLLVGTDSPTLPRGHLAAAIALAEANPEAAVFGPAEDGGYWCVGLSRPAPPLFRGIAWGGPDVLARTRAAAACAHITIVTAPSWYDIDTSADLERLRRELSADAAVAPASRAVLLGPT